MELLWIGIAIIALLVVLFYAPKQEMMTNKDLIATLKTFGEVGTTQDTKNKNLYQEPIYGPKTEKIVEPEPSTNGDDNGTGVYPDIYGPEITPTPGKCVPDPNKSESDCPEFNADFERAFPRERGDPQPFLTDFSKFQH